MDIGSCRSSSRRASVSLRRVSHSLAGKAGSRSTSATRVNTAGRFSRTVLMRTRSSPGAETEKRPPPNCTSALRRSNSSFSCWKLCFLLPRISIVGTTAAAGTAP